MVHVYNFLKGGAMKAYTTDWLTKLSENYKAMEVRLEGGSWGYLKMEVFGLGYHSLEVHPPGGAWDCDRPRVGMAAKLQDKFFFFKDGQAIKKRAAVDCKKRAPWWYRVEKKKRAPWWYRVEKRKGGHLEGKQEASLHGMKTGCQQGATKDRRGPESRHWQTGRAARGKRTARESAGRRVAGGRHAGGERRSSFSGS
ncbi:hypothetical protein GOP47_0005712 [Adiantum capillus-veneris]|uniref:Uncharacterized protein n=1 Tax=Adiantum capillus-veneris TaxID=13818 RepID=A0A9D4V5W0_ADICA|nr:hypothetical protein GOP47_0005712 [Adiantum capillus-veneris]